MRLWRVSVHPAFDGEGASEQGGRWNKPGTAVIYAAASLALATLEFLVHLTEARAPRTLLAHVIDVPDDVEPDELAASELPDRWDRNPGPPELQELGSRWASAGSTLLLSVPTAVLLIERALIPQERTYLINPAHSEFARVSARIEPYRLDPRVHQRRVRGAA